MHSSQSFRHLLVGTDFSRGADAALEAAIALATASPVRITLVHVCELAVAAEGNDAMRDDDVIAQCRARLDEVREQHRSRGIELGGLLRIGRPVDKINNAAAEVGASLIVVGRSGEGRAQELGGVADRVLRTASRSVLVVNAKETL